MRFRWTSLAALIFSVGFAGIARPVGAQDSAFLAVVRELATGRIAPSIARDRMKAALTEWDRQLARLQSQADTVQGHVTLGLAYRQRGRLNEALRAFDEALALQPARSAAADVHLLEALTLTAAGQLADASRAYRLAWIDHDASPNKAYLALTRSQDLDAAAAARARATLQAAYANVLAGTSPAEAPLVPTLDAVPDTLLPAPVAGEGPLARAFGLLAAGKLDEAADALADRSAGPAAGDSARDRIARGGVAEREGRLSDARREYAAAIPGTLAGRHALYVGIGRLAQVDGDLEAAVDAFGQAVRLNPDSPALRREFAGALVAAGRFDEAFTEFVAALLIAPGDAEVLAAVGQMFLDAGRAEDAIAPLRRALAVKADRYQTHYALAVALSRAGRRDEADREFEQFERLSRGAMDTRRRAVAGQPASDGAQP